MPSYTTALHEESEIFYEKSATNYPNENRFGNTLQSYCIIQSGLTTTTESAVEETGETQETIKCILKSECVAI